MSHIDDVAVSEFANAMRNKMKKSREKKGRSGWQDMSTHVLKTMLIEHIEKGDMVDVANFAMMIWHNQQR